MLPVLTAAQMREADRVTIEELGVPGVVLMETAGAAVAREVEAGWPAARPVVLCGKGNNGGDGFVAARLLLSRRPRVLLFARRTDVSGHAGHHLQLLERSGGLVEEIADEPAWRAVRSDVLQAGLIVDALLGTGLRSAPSGLVGCVIEDLAAAKDVPPTVAVDLPSGVDSDSGMLEWPSLRAAVTLTFAAPKHGHVLPPACDRVGRLVVADIGIPRERLERDVRLWLSEAADAARAFPTRPPASHKGDYGHVLVLGGSVGKTGAAVLAATAALRTGAGLVTVGLPSLALPLLVAAARPETMSVALPAPSGGWSAEAVEPALKLAAERDAVVLGPGLGLDPGARAFAGAFVAECAVPLLIDADALNALAAGGPAALEGLRKRPAATVLTPHPGEMSRLLGWTTAEVQLRRLEAARELAARSGAHVVLKGQRTLVAEPSGRAAVNPTGNPGMATAGSGDVLAGMVGALLGRGLAAWDAAVAGVYVHGACGDRAAGRLGQESLLAGDLIDALPEVLRSLAA